MKNEYQWFFLKILLVICLNAACAGRGRIENTTEFSSYPFSSPGAQPTDTPINVIYTPPPNLGGSQESPDSTPMPVSTLLTFKDASLYGQWLLFGEQSGQDGELVNGVLFGIIFPSFITDATYTDAKMEEAIRMISELGYNHFGTLAAGRPEGRPQDYISPFKKSQEWQRRRNLLLDLGLKYHVYISLILFDSPSSMSGYTNEDSSWQGQKPSADVAKNIAETYFLAGLDPNSARGKVVITDQVFQPRDSYWTKEAATSLDTWLLGKGFNTAGSSKLTTEHSFRGGQIIRVMINTDYNPSEFTQEADDKIRIPDRKAPAIMTSATSNSPDYMIKTWRACVSDEMSFVILLSPPFSLLDPDKSVQSENEWTGSTRALLQKIRGTPR